ncbi:hypothetical protein [Conexibacter sp. SYSU D00693]|uniref:hypothetical protein n=1 Tax=Conexibacter sp. SYSU D00693 TaxID=2812560 RepID=UPI00196A6EB8|nr:hypothetical protein [Conexibacter sp. SYSU D00693]
MDVSRLGRRELAGMVGGLLLVLGVLLAAYKPSEDNPNANIDGARDAQSMFDVHPILRWLLLLAAIAPFVLAWIIARGHTLSWARGEMTAVVAVAAFGLVFYNGIVDRPGDPSGEIGLQLGYWLALLGTVVMFVTSALRSSETGRPRKPPGTL